MNDTQQRTTGSGVEEAVRGFWSSRPQRPRAGRKVAGVCAAVANRYAIDPVLVRVGFAVMALFGGSGFVLYLLGWLFLAQQDDEVSAFEAMIGRGRSSVSTGFTVLLCLVLIPLTSGMFGGGWLLGGGLSGPIGFAMLIVGLYLLHRSRAGLGIVGAPPAAADTGAAEPRTPLSQVFGQVFAPAGQPRTAGGQATEWDPLGAAPFAWDLPDPEPPPPPRAPRPRRPRTGVTGLAVAIITAAICLALRPVADGWMTGQHILGVVLAAVGLCLVHGALRGGGRGLIPLATVLCVVGLVGTTTTVFDPATQTGSHVYTPTSDDQVRTSYTEAFGDMTLDLTKLPATGAVTTDVQSRFGNLVVLVPPTADVTATCSSKLGQADCLGHRVSGPDSAGSFTDLGTDGRGGLDVYLTADSAFGNLEVRRG